MARSGKSGNMNMENILMIVIGVLLLCILVVLVLKMNKKCGVTNNNKLSPQQKGLIKMFGNNVIERFGSAACPYSGNINELTTCQKLDAYISCHNANPSFKKGMIRVLTQAFRTNVGVDNALTLALENINMVIIPNRTGLSVNSSSQSNDPRYNISSC
jgi:hypothetical protein